MARIAASAIIQGIEHHDFVVMSAEEFRRLKGDLTGEALIAAMQASPAREIDLTPERAPLPVRAVPV